MRPGLATSAQRTIIVSNSLTIDQSYPMTDHVLWVCRSQQLTINACTMHGLWWWLKPFLGLYEVHAEVGFSFFVSEKFSEVRSRSQ